MYMMLKTKTGKEKKNQMLHIMDNRGKTYCQTENMKRKESPQFFSFAEKENRPVCKVCLDKREEREFVEPDLGVLMGEKIAVD